MKKKYKIETPGTYLAKILDIYDILPEELVTYALINRNQLNRVIHGNDLIPWSVAQYLKNNYDIPSSWWDTVNNVYCKQNNRKYVSVKTGHELLLNAILFEKD